MTNIVPRSCKMSNALEEAMTRQNRQAIFTNIAKKAEDKMIPVLDVAIDEIASRDAEVAELNRRLNEPVLLSEWQQLEKERDQLRKDVKMLRDVLNDKQWEKDGDVHAHNKRVQEALAATEPKP